MPTKNPYYRTPLSRVPDLYGAPMGRAFSLDAPSGRVSVTLMKLDYQGYDEGGAYWGTGRDLYRATNGEGWDYYLRAKNHASAVAHLRQKFPGIQFLRNDKERAPRGSKSGTILIRGQWWSSSSGRIELRIPKPIIRSCSHSGPCDDDIAAARRKASIRVQLDAVDADTLRHELREYGAWDADDLADHDANLNRLLWIACCDLAEGLR